MLLQMAKCHPFLWLGSIPLYIYTASPLSIHQLMDIWVAFYILATVNNGAMNIGVHVPFRISVSAFFGYISRGGIAGLLAVF